MRLEYGRHGHSTVGIGEYGPPAAEATNGPRREYVGSTKRVRRPRREYGGCGDSTQAIRIVHILYGQCGRSTDERQIVNVPIYTTVFWGSYLAFRSHTEYFRMWLTNEERILLQLTELVLQWIRVAQATLHLESLQEQERRKEEGRARKKEIRKTRRQRRQWVRQWLLRRPMYGLYEKLMHALNAEDQTSFRNFLRVDPDIFTELKRRVGPRIEKQNTYFRKAIPSGLKLAVTLRYLATGDSYKSLSYSFRVAANTISVFVPEVCQAIIDEYSPEVVVCPTTPDSWKQVASGFENRWNFPHTIGAIDGKHIAIKKPKNSGSFYYNYCIKDSSPLFYWLSLTLIISSSTVMWAIMVLVQMQEFSMTQN